MEGREERRKQELLPFGEKAEPPPTEPETSPLEAEAIEAPREERANAYEERLERRKQALADAAERAELRAEASFGASRKAVEGIPFGQPILRGHHSEGRHRRDLERSHRAMDRAVEESRRAEELRRRAASVGSAGISTDDPQAKEKLAQRLDELEGRRELMKRVNSEYRKGGWDAVTGLSEKVLGALRGDMERFRTKQPFPAYALKNLGANIRRIQKRMEELDRLEFEGEMDDVACEHGTYRMSHDQVANRVRFYFPEKPGDEVRSLLKREGFKWARSVGAWQRQMTANGIAAGERVRSELDRRAEVTHEPEAQAVSTVQWVREHDRNEVITRIKAGLKARSDRAWSVRGGRGTSYGWLTIDVPPKRRTFSHVQTGERGPDGLPECRLEEVGERGDVMGPSDREELARLLGYGEASSVSLQGVSVPAGHDYYAEFIDRAEGREPSVHGTPYWD